MRKDAIRALANIELKKYQMFSLKYSTEIIANEKNGTKEILKHRRSCEKS